MCNFPQSHDEERYKTSKYKVTMFWGLGFFGFFWQFLLGGAGSFILINIAWQQVFKDYFPVCKAYQQAFVFFGFQFHVFYFFFFFFFF